jgi:hypothetical protein
MEAVIEFCPGSRVVEGIDYFLMEAGNVMKVYL